MAADSSRAWLRPAVRIIGAALVLVYVAQFFGAPGVLHEGEQAPAFHGTLDDGSSIDLARSSAPLVLSFWASWCGPCRQEAPILNALHDDGVRVVGVNMDDLPADRAAAAARAIGMRFRILGGREDVPRRFRVEAVPTTYVIDSDGTIVLAHSGLVTREALRQALEKAR